MGSDYLGNAVTSDSPAVIAGVDDFVGGFLAYETRIERVVPAALAHRSEEHTSELQSH